MLNTSRLSRKKLAILSLCLSTVLVGCKVGPNYKQPQFSIQDKFHAKETKSVSNEKIGEKWWTVFNDSLLNEVIDDAVKKNNDIKIAIANIDQAKALRKISTAGLLPSLNADTSAARNKYSDKLSTVGKANTFNASLDASWEIDLFGKNRRSVEAATARLEAAEAQKNAVMLSIMAEVAKNYFEVRGLQKHIDVSYRSVGLLKELEKLAEAQFKSGLVTEFDVSRARGERESFEASIPNLEAEVQAGIYRISLLTGKEPEYYLEKMLANPSLPTPPDIVPIGMRSEILRRRPDITVSERKLAAASADIGIATADLFPSISLTGGIGTGARVFSDLFTGGSGAYSLAGALQWSVFNSGANNARIDVARASSKSALAEYEKVVLSALSEVETSLARYGSEWQTLKQLNAAVKTRKEGYRIAKLRYEAGQENFLVILDAERSLITAQDKVIQSETSILTDLTQLYKALGGGWQTEPKS
ncbi:MAG: outer membrane protein multidrug efflux system [Rickettsiaceae bacterium]|jgi:multidrug efflux system outer membrane protein|nr:outer membrane protein multidrug efflux system [Rickettsiaceae bacterium]